MNSSRYDSLNRNNGTFPQCETFNLKFKVYCFFPSHPSVWDDIIRSDRCVWSLESQQIYKLTSPELNTRLFIILISPHLTAQSSTEKILSSSYHQILPSILHLLAAHAYTVWIPVKSASYLSQVIFGCYPW